ncbi:hypothetical protein QWJ46_16605 [Rhizobium sp. CBN3]|uniref:hypothetical protein n=1 Tax=Rhizobium sp. CBN3 TaxID=3058045 RepID=UPI002673851C|nr:hypothetical protein [Rhizobium sp. CBN3]MDO3434303.1 hypothetical protein [Rhizobium sp. CBN3]
MTDVANIDLPQIEKNKSRHGTMGFYLRIGGKHDGLLEGKESRRAGHRARWRGEGPVGGVKSNTFRWLCMEYMRSDAVADEAEAAEG